MAGTPLLIWLQSVSYTHLSVNNIPRNEIEDNSIDIVLTSPPVSYTHLGRMGGKSYSAFSLGDTRFVLLDCGEDKPDDHWVYYDMNDFTRHRLKQAEFLKEELKSKAFRKARKRILIHHIPIFGRRAGSFNPCGDLWAPVLEKASFNVSLNAHTHRHQVIEKGEAGNNFPVIIGGSNKEPHGTVMAVSYTHLDVYKRQPGIPTRDGCFRQV